MEKLNILDLIGNTPMVELPTKNPHAKLLIKLESFNPGGSMKDRAALALIMDAVADGRLRAGGTIIESTSGNTGTAMAMIAAVLGYKFIALVDRKASHAKVNAMRAYGADVRVITTENGLAGRIAAAIKLESEIPGAIWLRQMDNHAALNGYGQMALEITKDAGGAVDVLVGALGTGGSLCGTATYIRQLQSKSLFVIGTEPVGSPLFDNKFGNDITQVGSHYLQSGTGWTAGAKFPENFDATTIDLGVRVSDSAAFCTARYLARHGLLLGGSAAANIYAAANYARDLTTNKTIVVIAPDSGKNELDTIYDDDWMREHELLDDGIETELMMSIE